MVFQNWALVISDSSINVEDKCVEGVSIMWEVLKTQVILSYFLESALSYLHYLCMHKVGTYSMLVIQLPSVLKEALEEINQTICGGLLLNPLGEAHLH